MQSSSRNSALSRAIDREWRQAARLGAKPHSDEILRRALSAPVSDGYFIGLDHACRMVPLALSGRLPVGMSPLRRQLWLEIAGKVSARRLRYPAEPLVDTIAHILAYSSASRFFITLRTAKNILSK